ncbi:MAG: hypothetical protein CRN43_16790 [Candidatus Nephrothrix sp. EaCA]|nr:MAG: hypothetical protein CRN43_16790 [Candidatus Nephrothrix sp. EaCA]
MTQKKFRVKNLFPPDLYVEVPQEEVDAFGKRLNERLKEVDIIFRINQKISAEVASRIILNA